jgi:asparagine synthetase B (glutamine-hydrolysing)
MSGFLVTRNKYAERSFIARRGPDLPRTIEVEGYHFSHYLLNVAGKRSPQPFVDGDIVCVLDGEIYNSPSAGTDPGTLISLYRQHGVDFARHLDGEFAVAIYDFSRREVVLATDPFGTKPLFWSGTEAGSYSSGLGAGEQVAPNTVIVVDLDRCENHRRIRQTFDFDHQDKDSYDDWIFAFERAVRKRATDGCYIPLSAGYDSGGIDCALRQLDLEYKAYSVEGEENLAMLRQRNCDGEMLRMDAEDIATQETFLRIHAERACYRVIRDGVLQECDMLEDRACCGLALIHSLARREGRKVFLSGQGADEILDARRDWPGYLFPDELRQWSDFSGGFQTAYLTKEDYVAGALGTEGRYPYLDRTVVQEFLWLSAELKNRHYKAPLHEYMTRCGYPFDEGVKTGFCPLPGGDYMWPWVKVAAD